MKFIVEEPVDTDLYLQMQEAVRDKRMVLTVTIVPYKVTRDDQNRIVALFDEKCEVQGHAKFVDRDGRLLEQKGGYKHE